MDLLSYSFKLFYQNVSSQAGGMQAPSLAPGPAQSAQVPLNSEEAPVTPWHEVVHLIYAHIYIYIYRYMYFYVVSSMLQVLCVFLCYTCIYIYTYIYMYILCFLHAFLRILCMRYQISLYHIDSVWGFDSLHSGGVLTSWRRGWMCSMAACFVPQSL